MFRGSEDAKKGVGLEYSNLQAHSTPCLSTPILSGRQQTMKWIKERQDEIIFWTAITALIIIKIVLPLAWCIYKHDFDALISMAIYIGLMVGAEPIFLCICAVKDWILYDVMKRERKEKPLTWWQEWTIDILVNPFVLDKNRISKALKEGLSEMMKDHKIQEMLGNTKVKAAKRGTEDYIKSVNKNLNKGDDSMKDILKGKLQDITKGEFDFTENRLNDYISMCEQDYSVKLHDGYFTLSTPKIVATLDYDSCRFEDGERSVTFKVLDLKPFRTKMFLSLISIRYPFMEYGKDAENTKLITCHLNKIPKLKDNKILNNSNLEHVTIDYIKCETGKATVKLKLKSKLGEIFGILSKKGGCS